MTSAGRRTDRSGRLAGNGILCGTDFSGQAKHALHAAAAMAKRLKEKLTLVHVIEVPVLRRSQDRIEKLLTASRRKDLREDANGLRASGIAVEERIAVGQPDEVLVEMAANDKPRLLVVSSVGHRGPGRWMVGSVSERTAERAPVATLVVRDATPIVPWAQGKRPLNVFVCFNFTATSEAVLRWVRELQAVGDCHVTVGFIFWPPEQAARFGNGRTAGPASSPRVPAILERDLKARATELLGFEPTRVRVEASWGRPDVRLAEMAREEQADLVVIGSHQCQGFERLWHSSISRGLLCEASTNVAVVPLATNESCPLKPTPLPSVRRVLLATDFSDLANTAIPHAYSLLCRGGTVHLLHVAASRDTDRRGARARSRDLKPWLEKLRALVPSAAAEHGIASETQVVPSDEVAGTICRTAERIGADVICLATHGRSGMSQALMGSVAQDVLRHSRRPLLLIRAQPQ